jgi:hypothetical protein
LIAHRRGCGRKGRLVLSPPRCATHRDADAEATCSRCGDFVCRLCTPLEPVALCGRCVVRTTVDWEERGELGLLRAFLSTLRQASTGPLQLGGRLAGAGHLVRALEFALLCAVSRLLPLSMLAAVPLLTWADAAKLGLDSTGFLGTAVSLLPGSLVLSTLWAVGVAAFAAWLWVCASALGIVVRFDVLTRAASYGASPLALPVFGPLLLPLALCCSGLTLYGALRVRASSGRAAASVALACLPSAPLVVGAFWWV